MTLLLNTQRVATGEHGIPEIAPEARRVRLLRLRHMAAKVSNAHKPRFAFTQKCRRLYNRSVVYLSDRVSSSETGYFTAQHAHQ